MRKYLQNLQSAFFKTPGNRLNIKAGIVSFLLFFICSLNARAQHPWLIKDVNATGASYKLSNGTAVGSSSSMLSNLGIGATTSSMYTVNGMVLFFGTDGTNTGIFKTDGTAAGTSFVATVPFGTSGYIWYVYNTGSILYFNLSNSLYRSDGTAAGTYEIFDAQAQATQYGTLTSGSIGSANNIAYYNGHFFFVAAAADAFSYEFFETDGTLAGTQPLFNYTATSNVNYGNVLMQAFNNKLYYLFSPGYFAPGNPDEQLFSYNLSTGTTNMEYDLSTAGNDSTVVSQIVNLNNNYLLLNGTFSGVNQVISISPTGTAPTTILHNTLGASLWWDYQTNDPIMAGGKLFFSVITGQNSDGIYIYRTYATDGTASGTNSLGFDDSGFHQIYLGTTHTGMIFQDSQNVFAGAAQNVYIWNGQSSNSYQLLKAPTDSLTAQGDYLSSAVQINNQILLFPATLSETLLTDSLGSYAYEVMDNLSAANTYGAMLNNSYICFAQNTSGLLGTGFEPYIFSPASWNIWTGKVSNDWHNSGNWLNNTVPDTSKEVILPDEVSSPILSSSGFCKDIYVLANSQDNQTTGSSISVANVTINQPASLSISRNLLNSGYITGNGSLTLTGAGSSQVSVYDCSYNASGQGAISPLNVDTINIKGANMDMTDVSDGMNTSSVISFQSDNQLVANYSSLQFDKKPFFTGYNSKRFIVTNRYSSISTSNDISQSAADSISTIPIGTNINSYTPITWFHNTYSTEPTADNGIMVHLNDTVYSQGATGNPITTNVVNKVWSFGGYNYAYAFKFAWEAGDQSSSFIPSNCSVETASSMNKHVWTPNNFQNSVAVNGVYSARFQYGSFIVPPDSSALVSCAIFSKPIVIPTVQASLVNVPNIEPKIVTLKWKNGNGALRAVFMAQSATGTPEPADGTTYTANTNFSSGSEIGSTGWFCVYNGSDSAANVAGLSPNTSYRVMVLEYSGGAGVEDYLKTTAASNPINFTTQPGSTDDLLSSLLYNGLVFQSPVFNPDSTNYVEIVQNATASVTITPTLQDTTATLTVNGFPAVSGNATAAIPVSVGDNNITIVVTAQDGITTKTYTLDIQRMGSSNVNLANVTTSSGTLSPVFSPTTTSYTDAVPNNITSIQVTPTLSDATAIVTVNNAQVQSGSASAAIPLSVGSNTVIITVYSFGYVYSNTDTITVIRAASSNASLQSLAINSGTLSPAFATGTLTYAVSVPTADSTISITPVVSDATATVAVNGIAVPSAQASGAIALNPGTNAIIVVVTAQNGTSQTYTVNVTRAIPTIFTLSDTNVRLTITGATCNGSDNGSVAIAAVQALNYTATITGNGLNASHPFTDTLTIGSLAAGTYSVCLTVAGQPQYQQCYSAVISQPQNLSVYAAVNSTNNSLDLNLSGGGTYAIKLNGVNYTTTNSTFSLPLQAGENNLEVTTDRLCQGTFTRNFNILSTIVPFPDPFQSTLSVNLGASTLNNATVQVYNLSYSKLFYSKQYSTMSGTVQFDLSALTKGVYALKITSGNTENIFKIIKQ